MKLTPDHPFYDNIMKYPTLANFMINGSAFFSCNRKNGKGPLISCILVKDGVEISYSGNLQIIVNAKTWDECKVYFDNAQSMYVL